MRPYPHIQVTRTQSRQSLADHSVVIQGDPLMQSELDVDQAVSLGRVRLTRTMRDL